MTYQPRSTNPYIMEKKLNERVGGGGFDPSVLEEIEADISVLGSENATMAQDIIDIKGSLNSINDNLTDGIGGTTDKFRFGTDGNGNYGYIKKVEGADTFFPFSMKAELLWTNPNPTASGGFASQKVSIDLTDYEAVIVEVRTSSTIDSQPRSRAYVAKENLNGNYVTVGRTIESNGTGYSRVITAIDDTGITFGGALGGSNTSNSATIPVNIYGVTKNILV